MTQTPIPARTPLFSTGLLAGIVAGIPTSGLMIVLSFFGGASLPEQLASTIALALPLPLFEYLRSTFGTDAKTYLFYIVLAGQCLIFALSGGLFLLLMKIPRFSALSDEQGRLRPQAGLLLALGLWLFASLVFLPLTGGGLFGSLLPGGLLSSTGSLAIEAIIFGLLFVYAQHWLDPRAEQAAATEEKSERSAQRRGLLLNSLKLLGVGGLGIVGWRFITQGLPLSSPTATSENLAGQYQPKIIPPPQPNYGELPEIPGLSPEITPTDKFYVVSKNFVSDPTVDSSTWKLTIDGAVEKPYSLTYKDVLALPQKKQHETLMCISNPVGGTLMGNALWEGVPLAELLKQAGVDTKAVDVILHGADGYADSILLTKALEPTTLLAVRMNDEPLTKSHGFPARVMVPGIYGMKHVKWLQRIEVVHTNYQGYWQKSGWSDPAPVRLTTRIDTPKAGALINTGTTTSIAGVAFSGEKGISQVNVSTDGGKTWQAATLKRPMSELTWVLWEFSWQPTEAGTALIFAHAVDLEGNVQDPNVAPPEPDGSSGYHSITVTVR